MLASLLYALLAVLLATAVRTGTPVSDLTPARNGLFAVTVDNGPADYTDAFLDALAVKKVKATFHVVADNLTDTTVQQKIHRMAKEGHVVGLYVGNKVNWNDNDDTIKQTIERLAGLIKRYAGYQPQWIRLPYGKASSALVRSLTEDGYFVTSSNLDTEDYLSGKTADDIYDKVEVAITIQTSEDTSYIALMHDAVSESAEALPRILDLVMSKGFTVVSLPAYFGLEDAMPNPKPSTPNNEKPSTGGGGPSTDEGTTNSNAKKTKTSTTNGAGRVSPPFITVAITGLIAVYLGL